MLDFDRLNRRYVLHLSESLFQDSLLQKLELMAMKQASYFSQKKITNSSTILEDFKSFYGRYGNKLPSGFPGLRYSLQPPHSAYGSVAVAGCAAPTIPNADLGYEIISRPVLLSF